VARARGLKYKDVEAIADGGVFTGAQAKRLGLVDVMGNFQDAVMLAASMAGIKGEPTLVWPEEEGSWLASLLRGQIRLFLKDIAAEMGASPGLQYRGPPSPLSP